MRDARKPASLRRRHRALVCENRLWRWIWAGSIQIPRRSTRVRPNSRGAAALSCGIWLNGESRAACNEKSFNNNSLWHDAGAAAARHDHCKDGVAPLSSARVSAPESRLAEPSAVSRQGRRPVHPGGPARFSPKRASRHRGGGASPSGKAADFDSAMRRFESSRPSQAGGLSVNFRPSASASRRPVRRARGDATSANRWARMRRTHVCVSR